MSVAVSYTHLDVYKRQEEEKMACFTEEGETVGAIFHAPDYLPSEKDVYKRQHPSVLLIIFHHGIIAIQPILP